MWATYWPKLESEESEDDQRNVGFYWAEMNNFAVEYGTTVWLEGAFEYTKYQRYIPWWRLTHFQHRNNVSAYIENFSGERAGRQYDRRADEGPSTTSSTPAPGTTFESQTSSTKTTENFSELPGQLGNEKNDINKYLGAILGVIVTLAVLGVVYLFYKRWNSSRSSVLTIEEINEFRLGSVCTNRRIQNDYDCPVNVDALRLAYDTSLEILSEKLEILSDEVLGDGEFGIVCKAILRDETSNLNEVALKMTKPNGGAMALRGLLSEIKILSYLGHHPNIVPIIGAYTAEIRKGTVYLATELCPLGSLRDRLRNLRDKLEQQKSNSDGSIPLNDMIRWSYEVACGMEYLGQKGVIHADLATRNVLLSSEGVAKIADFGLSRRLYEYINYTKKHQEPLPWRWMAIENLKISQFSSKSDVWSYGVTLWEIFSLGSTPYPGLMWTIQFVEMLEDGLRLQKPRYETSNIYDIMVECWNLNTDVRPTFSELKYAVREIMQINANK